ncbi:PIG-L family deacetylase [Thermoflavimicrobium dichotomicum]|uniref:GlcNAc-PI de-N-acetylase n=1 Tax=Thermoflavimicrobium dichotomicum TaxID=46223 RepID=A0A1I3QTD7_9BACL|nr:PIG-L family deacetylase [Thermoflavimicrobium dichotomicum]SFJ36722.1 GlcNAc-PI de-N-acetylase [Thermoflavimicrobium dichotomicum]
MNKRKQYYIVILFFLMLSVALPLAFYQPFQSAPKAKANKKIKIPKGDNVVVYFSPHADDEVLTYSVSILNDLNKGKKVYLVLISDGDRSFAREIVNGMIDYESLHFEKAGQKVYCRIHHTYHDPKKEKYKDGWLSRFDIGQARIREFYKAAETLGIPKEQVEVFTLKNDQYTDVEVRAIFQLYMDRFPDAEFKTMSKLDKHPDHAKLGKVLEELYLEKKIKKPTFFLSVYMDRFSKEMIPGRRVRLENPADRQKLVQALNVYKTWRPREGWYALGLHSVPEQFDRMAKNPYATIDTTSGKVVK